MQLLRVKWLAPVWVAGLLVHSQINHLDAGQAGNLEGRRRRGQPLTRLQPGDGAERSRESDYENVNVGGRDEQLYMNVPGTPLSAQLSTGSHVNGGRSHESRTAREPLYEEVGIASHEARAGPSNSVGNAERHFNPQVLLGSSASYTEEHFSPYTLLGHPVQFDSKGEPVYENVTQNGAQGTSPVSPIPPTYSSYVGKPEGGEPSQPAESSTEPVYTSVRVKSRPGWQRRANGVSGTREGVRQSDNGAVYTPVRTDMHSAGRLVTNLQVGPGQHCGKQEDEGDYDVAPVWGTDDDDVYGLVGIARGNRYGAELTEEGDYEELPVRGAREHYGQGESDEIYGSVGIARGKRAGGVVTDGQNRRGNENGERVGGTDNGIYEELPPPWSDVPVHSPPRHSTPHYPNVQIENPPQPNPSANVSARSGVQSLQVNPQESMLNRFKKVLGLKAGKKARKL